MEDELFGQNIFTPTLWKHPVNFDYLVHNNWNLLHRYGSCCFKYDISLIPKMIKSNYGTVCFNILMEYSDVRKIAMGLPDDILRKIGDTRYVFSENACCEIILCNTVEEIAKLSLLRKIRIDENYSHHLLSFDHDKIRFLLKFLKPYYVGWQIFYDHLLKYKHVPIEMADELRETFGL